jgi:4-amino-4-deoxy-L-arabinose transferase-like glycosyltransferase
MTKGAKPQPEPSARRWLWLLIGSFVILRIVVAADCFDYEFDEHYYTDGALTMLKDGDFLTPHYADGEVRFNKPPLAYWLVVLGYRVLGVGELASRLFFIPIGAGILWLTFRLGRLLLGCTDQALAAVAMLLSSTTFFYYAGYSTTDGLLSLAVLIGHYGFIHLLLLGDTRRRFAYCAYLGTGLAVATKGIPGTTPVLWAWGYALLLLWREREAGKVALRRLLAEPIPILLGAVVAGAWLGTEAVLHGSEFWHGFLRDQVARRFSQSALLTETFKHLLINVPFYWVQLLFHLLPWSLVFLAVLIKRPRAIRQVFDRNRAVWCYLLGAIALTYLIYLPVNIHHLRYLMPVLPFCAIALSACFEEVAADMALGKWWGWMVSVLALFSVALGVAGLIGSASYGARMLWGGAALVVVAGAIWWLHRRAVPACQPLLLGLLVVASLAAFDYGAGPSYAICPAKEVVAALHQHGVEAGPLTLGPEVMRELPAHVRVLSQGRVDFHYGVDLASSAAGLFSAGHSPGVDPERHEIVPVGYGLFPDYPGLVLGREMDRIVWLVSAITKDEEHFRRERRIGYLLAFPERDLAFHTGPVLGCAGPDFFTVACRTTVPAAVTLKVGEKSYTSPAGLAHTFRAEGLKPTTRYEYVLTAALPGTAKLVRSGPHAVQTLPEDGAEKLVFVALGDSRTQPKIWERVAMAAQKAQPAFVIHTGDLVGNSTDDVLWDEQFWSPAEEMLATRPFYMVFGNHERKAPLAYRLFITPNGKSDWAQQIGPVLLIGVDLYLESWKEDSANAKWLEETLRSSHAPFVFLVVHEPAWSSGPHGSNKLVQQVIFARLEKYKATAMIAGHDHCYERSEPGNGTTMLITGGGGAGLYRNVHAQENPHSKVFRSAYNYLVFTVEGEACRMQALTPEGEALDECEWKARK